MSKRKMIAMLMSLAMIIALCVCPVAEAETTFKPITWSASTAGAEGSNFYAGLAKFAELISERTDGAIKVEIYPSDQLTNGNQADSVQGCIDGTIDLAFEADGVWGNFDQIFCIPQLPFLFKSYEDVDSKLLNSENSKVFTDLLESKYNVKCIGIGENGFRYITNNKHPIATIDDLKGLKFRVGGSPLLTSTYTAWGADYTTAAWAEVYTGLSTGLYDGQENPIAVADASSIQEQQKYVTSWTAQYSCMFMTMNMDLYNSLSDELKAIVDECGKEACAYQVELTRQQCEDYLDKWINEYGIELTEMTEENIEVFKTAAQSVYDEYNKDYADTIALFN